VVTHEHVARRDVRQVIAQKALPGWGGDIGPRRHPPPDGGLAELEQFAVDARRTPQRIGSAHAADKVTDF
jgi:hypothetical protein